MSLTKRERNVREYNVRKQKRSRDIAILDMETEPFNNTQSADNIVPFLAVLYSDKFSTIVIWEDDHKTFIDRLIITLSNLPGKFTIYAHNGGKFDFMFLVSRLRGQVSFKGRGIMKAKVGAHDLRDSFHILPTALKNYKKDAFDYANLTKNKRDKFRSIIIDYCINDCKYLLELVTKFVNKHGFKISIGAASIAKLKEHYKWDNLSETQDAALRSYYKGGRVDCIAGAGYFTGPLKLYDVNSMYPAVMASELHPIGSDYVVRRGKPGKDTCFVKLQCKNNRALLARDESGLALTADLREGTFTCSIAEYNAAVELGLIWDVEIISCVDNFRRTTFSNFVLPLYEERRAVTERLATCAPGVEHDDLTADSLFLKLILNNAYGKFATNPRRWREYYITDPADTNHEWSHELDGSPRHPNYQGGDYWIWDRPASRQTYLNVGTAASITGGARARLMRAIDGALNPIYCDTDSLICEELRGQTIDRSELGAWKLETTIDELIVAGKKLYAYRCPAGEKIRAKGASGLNWDDMLAMLDGASVRTVARGVTMTRNGRSYYMARTVRATGRAARIDDAPGQVYTGATQNSS